MDALSQLQAGVPSIERAPPFRLLALGDPQLEGDSSLPKPNQTVRAALQRISGHLQEHEPIIERTAKIAPEIISLFIRDIPRALKGYRKRLDLLGNDYYLAHIYRTLYWWAKPTHVTVLGDLIGSQWVTDEEFERRGDRFWKRVFRGGIRVEDEITNDVRTQVLGEDVRWERRIINVAGNHDVGYAGDMNHNRTERFERVFGKPNWEIRFRLPEELCFDEHSTLRQDIVPELRIIVLNSLNLDGPVIEPDMQQDTYDFVNKIISSSRPVEDRSTGTILLTHIPLYKDEGICADGPKFGYHPEDYGGGIKEQNHLSRHGGKGILEGIYGMSANQDAPGKGRGRNGVILVGHDHVGCDTYHHIPQMLPDVEDPEDVWRVARWKDSKKLAANESIPGIREITVRSQMGEFGGNAGLFSAWFDWSTEEWKFEYVSCMVGKQHIFWVVHILDIVSVSGVILLLFLWLYESCSSTLSGVNPPSIRQRSKSGNNNRGGRKVQVSQKTNGRRK
ncbi:MAG: hypothetical protein M1824_002521 [Vezdaea acicularis]|nr:MAG: hypothetical protein M1824_002521 [Vezdaea acicularis]